MPSVLEAMDPPTSPAKAKRFAKSSVGFATTGVAVALGVGMAAIALGFARKLPFVNNILAAGGNSAGTAINQFGRVVN